MNIPSQTDTTSSSLIHPVINRMNKTAQHEIWHQRLIHPGERCMETIHKHVDGIDEPLHGNCFYRCAACMHGKPRKNKRGVPTHLKHKRKKFKSSKHKPHPSSDVDSDCPSSDILYLPDASPGQHFHMDFGFVRGSQYTIKQEDGPTITSKDGYNSYLLVIDRASRYTWIFLSQSKHPPVATARRVLQKFKSAHPHRTCRTDQGGELGRSQEFGKMCHEEGFNLELTGAEASSQNGMAESPNRVFAQMMRCALYSADLGPEYWSFALRLSVYVKNRLPHRFLPSTPYQMLTGKKPDISRLRVFGSRVCARIPGASKFPKLDQKNTNGIFLGYTATDHNIYFEDDDSGQVLISTHVMFDEAHLSTPNMYTPLGAQALQRSGYSPEDDLKDITPIQFKLLSNNATTPSISTPDSVGIDIYSAECDTKILQPKVVTSIRTDLALEPPKGTYARIASRSGLAFKHNIHVVGGVIDPDYRGNVTVGLVNHSEVPFTIHKGDRIAQVLLEKVERPEIAVVDNLSTTTRGAQGFGSTETKSSPITGQSPPPPPSIKDTSPTSGPLVTPDNSDVEEPVPRKIMALHTDISPPYHITLSTDPIDNTLEIPIKIKGQHPTLGLHLKHHDQMNRIQLLDCILSTPAARIPKWRSTLRHGFITKYNQINIDSIDHLQQLILTSRNNNEKLANITFSTVEKQSMHPVHGVPQLDHEQLNIIANHLDELRATINDERCTKDLDNIDPVVKKLTRRALKVGDDWNLWEQAEFQQLDNYEKQDTFGPPCSLPQGANALNLLWTYMFKIHENRRKARCVCNGAKNRRGCVTLAETFASSLEQTGSRIFWAATAIYNHIVIGADASNAFAEAPPPKAPLYVYLDAQFHNWWKSKGYKPLHPSQKVMRVKKALQGHPESPRLWAKLIDKIINKLGFTACHHEPCLYVHENYKNNKIFFLRQVDDFAVSAPTSKLAEEIIADINSHMSIDIKSLGVVDRFNGVDIQQSRNFVKIFNKSYIDKILKAKGWLDAAIPDNNTRRIPMHNDKDYNQDIEIASPIEPNELPAIEKEFGFTYKQAIGELIYALVTCRPDISYPLIKLSQYSTKPARIHFEAVRGIYQYLKDTKHEGIHYWRPQKRNDCPFISHPTPLTDYTNYTPHESKTTTKADVYDMQVDASYSGDVTHRKSVTGMIGRLAGGTITYKTKFQDIVALSSTEAEFIAACDAGKTCLYIRSILEDLGIPQDQATILYEDNKGAIAMANAGRPTKRTKHVDTRYFALQSWVEEDLLLLKSIPTSDNSSDAMTKNTPRILFNRHNDFILGRTVPTYVHGI